MNGKSVKEYISQTIRRLDNGDLRPIPHRFHKPSWVRKVVAPAAIGISVGLCGCTDTVPVYGVPVEDADYDEVTDTDAQQDADAQNDADQSPDSSPDADAQPDADNEPDADEEPDSSPDADTQPDADRDTSTPDADSGSTEICDDRMDNDGDGLCDCLDSDCVDHWNCLIACPEYGGPFPEGECDDCKHGCDGDGLADCDDPECFEDPACT